MTHQLSMSRSQCGKDKEALFGDIAKAVAQVDDDLEDDDQYDHNYFGHVAQSCQEHDDR